MELNHVHGTFVIHLLLPCRWCNG